MKSLPTLPSRSWLERVSLGLATGLLMIGLGSMLGWWGLINDVLIFSDIAPLRANAALGIIFFAGALLAWDYKRPRLVGLAIVPLAIGVLTLAEHIFHVDLKIDELLATNRIVFDTSAPGR